MAGKPRSLLSVRRHRGGVAAVEFALIAPILLACLAGVYDLGAALQAHIHLQQAVRAGGLYATSYPPADVASAAANSAFSTSLISAVKAAAPDWTNITVTPTSVTCMCWNSTTNAYAANATCVACTGGTTLEYFVSVNAHRPFVGLFYTTLPATSASYVARIR